MSNPRRLSEQGFVLVNALIIVAALSVMALQILARTTDQREEIAAAANGSALALMADAGVRYAAALLEADFEADSSLDHPGEAWAITGRVIEVDRGTVELTLSDAQARFNLNMLAGEHYAAAGMALERLLLAQGSDLKALQALRAHFAPISARAQAGGVQNIPGNEWFETGDLTHAIDLEAINGLTPENARDLLPLVEALPRVRLINVNTADPKVLAAATGLEEERVAALVAMRSGQPFDDLGRFQAAVETLRGEPPDASAAPGLFDLRSFWFDADMIIRLEDLSERQRVRLYRDPETGRVQSYFKHRLGS